MFAFYCSTEALFHWSFHLAIDRSSGGEALHRIQTDIAKLLHERLDLGRLHKIQKGIGGVHPILKGIHMFVAPEFILSRLNVVSAWTDAIDRNRLYCGVCYGR